MGNIDLTAYLCKVASNTKPSPYRVGFDKRAAFAMADSMDIMPDLVRGNSKLKKVVDNILNKRTGSSAYSDAVQAIKNILNSVKTNGINHPMTKQLASAAVESPYQILSKTPHM